MADPREFVALQVYRPPSWTLTLLMFTWLMTSPAWSTYCPIAYLWPTLDAVSISPSKNQENCGGGLPVAEQCSETGDPGLRTCSMKVDCSSGTVSATQTGYYNWQVEQSLGLWGKTEKYGTNSGVKTWKDETGVKSAGPRHKVTILKPQK
jgi:hypothetical protein